MLTDAAKLSGEVAATTDCVDLPGDEQKGGKQKIGLEREEEV